MFIETMTEVQVLYLFHIRDKYLYRPFKYIIRKKTNYSYMSIMCPLIYAHG